MELNASAGIIIIITKYLFFLSLLRKIVDEQGLQMEYQCLRCHTSSQCGMPRRLTPMSIISVAASDVSEGGHTAEQACVPNCPQTSGQRKVDGWSHHQMTV